MKTPILALAISAIVLSACGESRLNPFNWFKKSVDEPTIAQAEYFDPEGLIDRVLEMHIDQTLDGAIIHAVGLPPTQGYWGAELLPMNNGIPVDGVLTYRFDAFEPVGFERVVNQRSREVLAATRLSHEELEGVTAIRIIAASNSLISRR